MSLFNDKLKKITLKELLSLVIVLFLIQYFFNYLNIVHIDSVWIYILLIFYFIFKLKDELFSIKTDIFDVFTFKILKSILAIVILNIFFSYGMLYLTDFALNLKFSFISGAVLASIFVSPLCEELIFRGVFLNRLKLAIPLVFSLLISSLLFAALHPVGSIFSAFVFALCVGILYIKTENIFTAIFAHFLNNVIAEIIVFTDSANVLFTNPDIVMVMSVLSVISFALISMSLLRELKRLYNSDL